MQRRKRSTPHTLEDYLAAEKAQIEAQISVLPMCEEKAALLKKIRQIETASHMNEWLSSPGLQSPK
ncbi:hypothetical protein [Bradyrhizobium sp. LTSPM299]|uniref:hypothetical protein n=1 Tax=Bradyrhizobium sp. LTSPM299 TaxID=1619233 RepID=UPI0009E618A8|nr:hypothetical protein [Bradyrhizobium sp. LTSPM299]